jgi:hypothetical protein
VSARRLVLAAVLAAFAGGCATEGAVGVSVGYDASYYDPWNDWYGGGGCCIDYPDGIGPPRPDGGVPHPSNPIANVPGRPPNPDAPAAQPKTTQSQSSTRSMSSPRPASMSHGGGGAGRGGGGGRR